jgi:hypothetical protein
MAAKAQHKGKRSNSQMFHFNLLVFGFQVQRRPACGAADSGRQPQNAYRFLGQSHVNRGRSLFY